MPHWHFMQQVATRGSTTRLENGFCNTESYILPYIFKKNDCNHKTNIEQIHSTACYNMKIYNILYFYISMFCTDTCHKQPLGEVLHSVEICFVTSLLNISAWSVLNTFLTGRFFPLVAHSWSMICFARGICCLTRMNKLSAFHSVFSHMDNHMHWNIHE